MSNVSQVSSFLKLYLFSKLFTITLMLTTPHLLKAQMADLRLIGDMECGDSTYHVKLQIKSQNENQFQPGHTSVYLTFDHTVLRFVAYQSVTWNENTTCGNDANLFPWYPHGIDAKSVLGQINITLSVDPDFTQSCSPVDHESWQTIGIISYEVKDIAANPNIQFASILTPQGNPTTAINSLTTNNGTQQINISNYKGVDKHLFSCENATLLATISIQGRTQYDTPVTLAFYDTQEDTHTPEQYQIQSDAKGKFVIENISPGKYDISLHAEKCLKRVQNLTLSAGNNSVVFPQFRTGDANHDNMVDILDFTILLNSYNQLNQNQTFDSRADFNEDGVVNLFDFSLMLTNYNLSGETR